MDNNISQCHFNGAFDNRESKELDKLARKINNKHAKSDNTFSKKFSGIICDQLDCTPYSQQIIGAGSTPSFFSAQGDYSPIYAPVNTPVLSLQQKDNNSVDSSSFGSTFDKKVYSESDSFQSLSSDALDNGSLSSTYSSLPTKIKKRLRMSSPHLKKYKQSVNSDDNDIQHLKSCDDCRSRLLALLSGTNLLPQNNIQINKPNNNSIQKSSNSFLNLTNPELKDVMVLILIGVIIIMLIDIFVRQ